MVEEVTYMKKIIILIFFLFSFSILEASDFDPSERYKVPLQESFSKGSKDPSVTIVEFSAFNCPPCQRLAGIFDDVLKDYPDDVRLVFKHGVPRALELEKEAVLATWASGQQGSFWEMHDLLFQNKERGLKTYLGYALDLGLDTKIFLSDWESQEAISSIEDEWRVSSCLGNYGTPNFFVNGKKYAGELWTHERIREIIDDELDLMKKMGNPNYEEVMNMSEGEEFLCGQKIFEIVPSLSEARFLIDETLRGEPITVVGTNKDISGLISIDFDFPQKSSVDKIVIDSSSFVTDSSGRNRAIRQRILSSSDYPQISFKSLRGNGIPEKATFYPDQKYEFTISGEMTIRDRTLFETFDVVLEIIDFETIKGTAKTSALWFDYGVDIPQPQFVQIIDDELRIEFDFFAKIK